MTPAPERAFHSHNVGFSPRGEAQRKTEPSLLCPLLSPPGQRPASSLGLCFVSWCFLSPVASPLSTGLRRASLCQPLGEDLDKELVLNQCVALP